MASLELIAAVAANGVIGRDNALPWHLPADLKHFKTTTLGHPILMGRRTWESVGKPLPKRRNIVISTTMSQPPAEGVEIARSLDAALILVRDVAGPVFIVGGHGLYAEALPRADVLHLTELEDAVEGDTRFPTVAWDEWKRIASEYHGLDEKHVHAFRINRYERVK